MSETTDTLEFPRAYLLSDAEFQTETNYAHASSTIICPSDVTTEEMMNAAEASGALSFWDDPGEDVYNENDGDAV